MVKYLKIVQQHKASHWQRFANYIIDLLLMYIMVIIVFGVVAFAYIIISGENLQKVGYEMEHVNSLLDRIISLITYAILMFLMEWITKGRSIGKLITGTKVIKTDGTKPSAYNFFIRNISRAVPFDFLSFFGTDGWHDSWSDTRVVKLKDYETAKNLEDDLKNIGNKENT